MSENFDRNKDNAVGAWAIANWNLEPAQFDSVLNLAGETLKANPLIKMMIQQQEILKKTAEGAMFTDFTIEQPDGSKVSLSDYVGKGKYVLVLVEPKFLISRSCTINIIVKDSMSWA